MRLLGERDFRLLFGAQAISMVGDRMVPLALAFAVLELGGSAAEVGAVLAARALPMVASLLAGGVVADRTSRRAIIVAADLVRLAAQGVLAVLLIAGRPDLLVVGMLAGITGAAAGFAAPASTGLLPEVVDPEDLHEANGLRATAFSAGELVGPLAAGLLVAAAGPGWALAIDALSFGVSAALMLQLAPPAAAPAGRPVRTFAADLRDGWDAFRARRWLWTFVLWAAVGNMLFGAFKVLGPVVADRELGGAAVWGAVLTAMGAGTVLGGVLALRLRPRRPLLVSTLTGVTLAAPPMALAASTAPVAIAAGTFAAGAGLMLGNALWETTVQRHIPREQLSRVSAYDWFGSLALDPIGLAIWGPVAVLVGVDTSLWLSVALLAASTLALLAVPEIRRLPAAPPRPV